MINTFLGKSEIEFWQIAENWYARTHRLREVWQNDATPFERKLKAILLWHQMVKRCFLCVSIATHISKPKPKSEWIAKSGMAIINEKGPEII